MTSLLADENIDQLLQIHTPSGRDILLKTYIGMTEDERRHQSLERLLDDVQHSLDRPAWHKWAPNYYREECFCGGDY